MSARGGPDEGASDVGPVDLGLAALLALCFGALYLATYQTRLTGDGAGLAGLHALGGHYYNILFLPAARWLGWLLPSSFDPIAAPKLLSVVGAGLGVGLAFLVARGFGSGRRPAGAAVLLLGLSPALWFFATTIEIHALHFAAVGLCACVTLYAPWRRPALALALVALSFPLLFWTEQTSPLLGPGWVLLVQYARTRVAPPFRWRTLLFGVGPVLLAMLLLALAVSNLVRFGRFDLSVASQASVVDEHFGTGHGIAIVWLEWAGPLALFLAAAAVGLARGGFGRWAFLALAGLLLPPMAFFFTWGIWERGGYFLPSAVFLTVLAARAFTPFTARAALALVLAAGVQAWHARRTIDAYDQGFDVRQRVALVHRLLPDGGTFASTVECAPPIAVWLPEVEEIDLWNLVTSAWVQSRGTTTPEEVEAALLPQLGRILSAKGRVVLELGFEKQGDGRRERMVERFLEPLVRDVEARYATRRVDDPWWPMLVVEARPASPPSDS